MLNFEEQLRQIVIDEETGKSAIAIVDDDPSFSFMLKDYLYTSAHIKSDLYSDGDDFLKNFKPKDNRKIILDYDFGRGSDGLTVLNRIKAMNPMAVVIMVSSQDNLEKAVETLRKGASDYFVKTNKTVFANILCSLIKIKEMEKHRMN